MSPCEIPLGVGERLVHVVHDANQVQCPLRRVLIVGRDGRDGIADVAGAAIHEQAIAANRGALVGIRDRPDIRERRET